MIGRVTVLESDSANIECAPVRIYPTGIEFTVNITSRRPEGLPQPAHEGVLEGSDPDAADRLPRFSVAMSSEEAVVHGWPYRESAYRPGSATTPSLVVLGGGTTKQRWSVQLWAEPLPTSGRATVAVEWPQADIERCEAVLFEAP